jgi:hypothetical protein
MVIAGRAQRLQASDLGLNIEFGNSAFSSGFRLGTPQWIMADIVTSAMRASHRPHHS